MSDRPTQVRWLILGATTLVSVLLYLDRICVSFAAESIRVEFGASPNEMGWFLSAFFWSYALGQVPAGWLSDRFGIRRTLTAYILLWSLFTGLMGVATGIIAIIGYRLGLGLAQAGAYPSAARAVRDWMPIAQRGTASSIVALGGRVGGVLAPLLTSVVMLSFAHSDGNPDLQPAELRDAAALAKSLMPSVTFTWRTELWGHLASEQQASLRGIANKAVVDPDEQLALFNVLPIKQVMDSASLDSVPSELERRFSGKSSVDPAMTRRQFFEAVAPTAVRKLEARGWRRTMIVYGAAGLFVAALFWAIFRERPSAHPGCNAAEQQLIGETTTIVTTRQPLPLAAMVQNLSLWGNCLAQFATNVGWVFLVTWLPRYLEEVHRVPVVERGVLSSIPIAAGIVGMLLGGPWTDVMSRRFGLKTGRTVPVVISRVIAALGYGGCVVSATGVVGPVGTWPPVILAVAGLGLVAIGTDLGIAATWAFAQDVGGENTAAVLGWGNMWGNLGAAIAPVVAGNVLGKTPSVAEWNWLFAFCAGAFIVAAVGASLMDASRPLVPSKPASV